MCWLAVLAKSPDGFSKIFVCFDLSLDSFGKNGCMSVSDIPLPSWEGKWQHKFAKRAGPAANKLLSKMHGRGSVDISLSLSVLACKR